MRALLCALALCVSAAPAWAQSPMAVAQGLIEEAQAQGVFEPVEDDQVKVRHVGSGLPCTFFLDSETSGRLILYDGSPRGDDVSCEMRGADETTSLYATRYPDGTTLRAQLDGAEAAILQRFRDARRIAASLTMTVEGGPEHEQRLFLVTLDGRRYLTLVDVALVGPWVIKLRYTATAADDDVLVQRQLMAGAIFNATLIGMEAAAPTDNASGKPD